MVVGYEEYFNREAWEKVRPLLLALYGTPQGRLVKGIAKRFSHSPVVDIIALKAAIGHGAGWGKHAWAMKRVKAILAKYPNDAGLHFGVKYLAFANEVVSALYRSGGDLRVIRAIREKYVARGAKADILDEILQTVLR